jgi:hypothetical protein
MNVRIIVEPGNKNGEKKWEKAVTLPSDLLSTLSTDDCDNPEILNQDCSRKLFRWFLSKNMPVDWGSYIDGTRYRYRNNNME